MPDLMSRTNIRQLIGGAASAVLVSAGLLAARAATLPVATSHNAGSLIFSRVSDLCAGPGYLAIDGEDEIPPNNVARKKLVVLAWESGLTLKTALLDEDRTVQAIRCKGGEIDLLIAGSGETDAVERFAIGTDIKKLPSGVDTIPHGSAARDDFNGLKPGCKVHLGLRDYASFIKPLGVTKSGQLVVLVMKDTRVMEPGSGYTGARSVKVTVGRTPSSTVVIEQSDNFEPSD